MSAAPGEPDRHLLGVTLVITSAVIYSLAGVLTKAIQADVWTIACWRGLIGGLLVVAYVAWLERRRPTGRAFRLGWQGWLLATVGSLGSLAFIYSFKLTYVANVAIIYATAPFMAAALAWVAMRERFRLQTACAAMVSVVGIAVVFAGSLGTGNSFGDGMALVMAFGSALYMVLIRRFRDSPVVLAGGVSALQLFVVGCLVTDPFAVTRHDALLLVLFGLAFAIALVLWTEGTKLIPAAEAGFLGTVETPFAMLLAWIVLAELPPPASFLGAGIVLAAIIGHALADVRRARADRARRIA
ncbi:MAG: DMT family transporter [Kiloniellaceae bacterium]